MVEDSAPVHGELDEKLSEYIDLKLEPLVNQAVKAEEEVRYRQLKWIVVFVGVVGVGTFVTLTNYLIKDAVEDAVEEQIGFAGEQLEIGIAFTMATKIAISAEVPPEDVRFMMTFLEKAANNDKLKASYNFTPLLIQVAQSLVSAGLSRELDKLVVLFETEVLRIGELTEAFLHHYGQEIVGRPIAPDINDFALMTFEKLERAAPDSGYPELGLLYRTLYEANKSRGAVSATVVELLGQSTQLNDGDRILFFEHMLLRSNWGNWVLSSTPAVLQIERSIRQFFYKYSNDIAKIYGLSTSRTIREASNGLNADDAAALAQWIAFYGKPPET